MAGKTLRYYLTSFNLLEKIINLKHFQVFDATTYTAITILSKTNKYKNIKYYEYDEIELKEIFIDNLNYDDFFIKDNYYFSDKEKLKWFKNIINYNKNNSFNLTKSNLELSFNSNVIYNNYKEFIEKIFYYIKSI